MVINLKRFAAICMLVVLFAACRKNTSRIVDPNDIVESEPAIQKPVTIKVNESIGGFYSAVPVHYNETTKRYPLLVFLPGAGQFGNGAVDLPYVLNDGVAKLLDKKQFPPNFFVQGQNFSIVVLTPQFSRYPSNDEITSFIVYATRNYRIDITRIYLAGLSMGGFVTSDYAAENTSSLAAAVPISGVLTTGNMAARCLKIAQGNMPLWVFHNTDDPTINVSEIRNFVSTVNGDSPTVPAKLTLFNAAIHDAWTQAIDPSYKENNMNIYEWMLQYKN